ncbi:MAG: cytochrome c maturation protein CcmE [Acidimicrobiales bacterium]
MALNGTELRAAPSRRRALGSRRQRLLAGAVLLAALGYLLAQGLTNAMNYYLTAKQAVAKRAELGERNFRIQGTVAPGAHQKGKVLYFSITDSTVTVPVVSTGLPTQLFRTGMPVVLVGHWSGDVFDSSQIMVQHGSSYVEARSPGRAPVTVVGTKRLGG